MILTQTGSVGAKQSEKPLAGAALASKLSDPLETKLKRQVRKRLIVFDDGSSFWDGCEKFSNIVQFTVAPVCKKVLIRARFVVRNHRRILVPAHYKAVCT